MKLTARTSRPWVAAAVVFATIGIAVGPAASASAAGSSPPVLNPLTANVPGVDVAAVQALESSAVSQVIASHGLLAGDGDAVLGWARGDVRAVEFNDITQIISEGAAKRSSGTGLLPSNDDQLVYNWFQGVVQQQRINAAQQGINEFKRWSGLTALSTTPPVNFGPSQSFPGGYGDGAPVSTGFCGFAPPGGANGPFAGTYSASGEETCYIPCTDVITDCYPPEPDVSQFEQWGLYDAESKIYGSPDFMQAGADAAIAEGAGVAAAIAGFTTPISIKTGPLLTHFVEAIAPNAVRAINRAATAIAAAGAEAAAEAGVAAAETASEIAAAATGALSASLVTGIVGVIIDFIISTVLAGITLNQQLTEPDKLQQVLTDAQTTPEDLESDYNSGTDGIGELFSAFVGATLPEAQTDCSLSSTDPCFTPPTPPAHTGGDPAFLVTPASGGTGTIQASLYSVDPLGLYFNSTYMSGNGWFVSKRYNAFDAANATTPTHGGATVQSLSFEYVDWSGNHWSAERLTDSGGHTKFSLTPLDESNQGACSKLPNGSSPCLTDSIQIQVPGSGGVPYDATVKLIPAASLNPTLAVSYTTPGTVGQAITFTPHGSDPSSLPLTYTWAFPVSGNQGCVLDASNHYCGFTTSSSGVTTWTFHAAGVYQASVIASDSNGYSTAQSFIVNVVSPTVTSITSSAAPSMSTQAVTFTAKVAPSDSAQDCSTVFFGPSVTGFVQFKVDNAKVGGPVELTPTSCTNYDATRTASISIPNLAISAGGHSVTAQFLGSAAYTASQKSLTQVVTPESDTTTITPSATTIVYGQAVSFRAAVVPVAPGLGLPTGTVQWYVDGNALGAPVAVNASGSAFSPVTRALNVNQVQLGGPTPNVRAVYSGDGTFPGSQGTFKVNVKSSGSKTTVTSSGNPSALGQPVSFTANVTSTAPGSGIPSGCVQFAIDGVNVGSRILLNAGGAATLPATAALVLTGAGTKFLHAHVVTAQYLGLAGDCQSVILNARYLTSTGTMAPAQTVLSKATPTVTGATVPAVLSSAPFTFSFYKPVKGVDATGKTNVNVTEVGHTTPITASIVCKNAKAQVVSCATGAVSFALLTPKTPLIAGEEYFTNVDRTGKAILSTVGAKKVPPYQGYVRAQTSFTTSQFPVHFTWGTVSSSAALGGSFAEDPFGGASVTTALTLKSKSTPSVVLMKGPALGIATVQVFKGATQLSSVQVDTYAATLGRLTHPLGTLGAGAYTVRVTVAAAKNAASTGYAIGVDAVIANGVTTNTPVLSATWATSIPDDLGGSYFFTTQQGATMSLTFRGTGVSMRALIGVNDGKAQVLIDGNVVATQDQYASNYSWATFSYSGLADTFHTVTLKVLGTKQAASSDQVITFDGITVH